MATTKDYRLGEFTFPRGWFMIAEAAELDTHRPLAVRFFGKDFALYRGRATGKVVLLDAYCPHMKTHLAAPNKTSYVIQDGMGTNVEGDGIRCPYHAWRFGPDGKCDDIPYHKGEIPAAACVKSWTVVESLGAVFVWHDPEGGEADWDQDVYKRQCLRRFEGGNGSPGRLHQRRVQQPRHPRLQRQPGPGQHRGCHGHAG